MPQLGGPRPDPGFQGGQGQINRSAQDRKVDRLKARRQNLRDENARLRKLIREHPGTQRANRTQRVREATAAIKAGKAEAHPIVIEHGFHGETELSPKERIEAGIVFSESLRRTHKARQKGKRVPAMATPKSGQEFAAGRKPTRRKPVRKATRMSGSGR